MSFKNISMKAKALNFLVYNKKQQQRIILKLYSKDCLLSAELAWLPTVKPFWISEVIDWNRLKNSKIAI